MQRWEGLLSTHDEFPFAGPVKEEKKWSAIPASKKDWFATVLIFLLPPLGLYFLWRGKVYWRRDGKPMVVSSIRKFVLSIPAVLIMLIGVSIAMDKPILANVGSNAVASTDAEVAERQKTIADWLQTCAQAHDTYLKYVGTGDASYIMLGDRGVADCQGKTPAAIRAISVTRPQCAAPIQNFADGMSQYRGVVLRAQSYNEDGMKGMAADVMDTAQAREKALLGDINRCTTG